MSDITTQNFSNPPVHRAEIAASQPATDPALAQTLAAGVGFAASLAGKYAGFSTGGALPGLITGAAGAGGGLAGAGGLQGDIAASQTQFVELLRLQNQLQVQSQTFNMLSNSSKTQHETAMAPIRNIRA